MTMRAARRVVGTAGSFAGKDGRGYGCPNRRRLDREVLLRNRASPLRNRIFFLYFHDTYHVGQTELLRQLAGVGDKVI